MVRKYLQHSMDFLISSGNLSHVDDAVILDNDNTIELTLSKDFKHVGEVETIF